MYSKRIYLTVHHFSKANAHCVYIENYFKKLENIDELNFRIFTFLNIALKLFLVSLQ